MLLKDLPVFSAASDLDRKRPQERNLLLEVRAVTESGVDE